MPRPAASIELNLEDAPDPITHLSPELQAIVKKDNSVVAVLSYGRPGSMVNIIAIAPNEHAIDLLNDQLNHYSE